MKEIKFRAWLNGKMLSPERTEVEIALRGFKQFETEDCILMPYIGRKDKNNKEIYEGDITEEMSWITWCDVCCSFELFVVDLGCANCNGDISWREFVDNKNIQVIGNIYEHSYLLEIKED